MLYKVEVKSVNEFLTNGAQLQVLAFGAFFFLTFNLVAGLESMSVGVQMTGQDNSGNLLFRV